MSLSAFQRIIEWDGMDFLPWFLWTSTKDPHSALCASFNVASAISPFFCIALLSFRYQSDSHCESHNWIIPSAITFQRDFHVTFCSLPVTRNLCSSILNPHTGFWFWIFLTYSPILPFFHSMSLFAKSRKPFFLIAFLTYPALFKDLYTQLVFWPVTNAFNYNCILHISCSSYQMYHCICNCI